MIDCSRLVTRIDPVSGDGCRYDCRQIEPGWLCPRPGAWCAYCGNGVIDPLEVCDDGNALSGDGCSSGCTFETVCGDGVLEGAEGCDDGNRADGDGCGRWCQLTPFCGDGVANLPNEACDDGNDVIGDLCGGDCFHTDIFW